MTLDPSTLRAEFATGPPCFLVTHAREDFGFDEEPFREHVAWQSSFPVAAVFAAAGTGEFPTLTPLEIGQVVRAAVTASARPVIAPAGYGIEDAVAMARDAEEAGAAGVFLLPRYLAALPWQARDAYVRAVCAATSLGVLVHDLDGGLAGPAADCANFVRMPAGVGETSVLVNFAPRFALELHTAVCAHDTTTVYRMLDEFVVPYQEIRGRRAGYAVAAAKAALTAVGRPAGPVRPPLTDLTDAEFDELKALVDKADLT